MWRGVSATRLAACLLVLGLVGVQGTVAVGAAERATASWTFMVYLDGDNNLESCGLEDFMEMASIGSNTQINILVQFDRGTNSDSDGGSSDYGNWASTKRFHVSQGETPTAGNQISDLGETNMGSAATLQSFLEWGMNGYPASKYALVLWDHGGGWIYGVCSDDTDSDSLLMAEVRQAIASAEASTSKRVDLVGFDACLMGMVEVAYDLRSYSDTVVFSEETEPGQGWAYDKVLASLAASPAMTSQQLGAVVVDAYSDYYGSSGKETLSAVSTSSLASVSSALNSFAAEMSSAYPSHSAQINAARSAVQHFEYEMIVDLYDLALRTKNAGITTTLGNAADRLMSEIQAAVTQEAHGNLRPGAHGLSIYFPDVRSDLNLVGYRSDMLLTQDTSWDEFLETFFQGASSDQWEPDDVYTQASELVMGVPQYHSILDGGADVDWAYFTLPSATEVVIETSGVSGDTELYLFAAADVPSYYTAYDDDGGADTFSRISTALPAGTYYLLVREYGQNREIDSYQLLITTPLQADAYEPDNDHTQASIIALDSMQLHSIGDGGADVDWIGFTLATTQSVRIETTGESGDTRIWLYEEIGSQLFNVDWDDDSGPGLFSRLDEVDLAPGAYFIEVDEYYNDHEIALYQINVSSFSLDDEFEPDGDYLHASELVPGDSQWHSIGEGGQDVDWFQFPLHSDSDVLIETSGDEGDTVMSLYSAADVPDYELETDDDSGDGYFSMLDLSALQSGQYYVAVEAYEGFYGFEPIPGYHISILTDPSSPVGLSAFISGSGVHLQWSTPVSDGGFPIDHYQVWRALNGGTSVAYSDAPSTSFFDDGVIGGEGYVYSVIAVTEFGGSQPADAVQIQVPVGIGTPDVISQCWVDEADDSISLTWPEPDPNGSAILAYHVYRGTMADGSDRHEIGQSTGPAFIDLTVEKGRTYYYWVAGENSNGMGAVSAPTVATAITTSGLGALPWVPILAAIVVVASAMVLVVIWAKRGRSRSRSGGELPQTMQPGPQIQMDQGRCPGCHAPTEGLPFCGNCGRRLL